MSSNYGKNLKITLFGEAKGLAVGVVIDGLQPGVRIDFGAIDLELKRRRGGNPLTSPSDETDIPVVFSGIRDEVTCGTPVCAALRTSEGAAAETGLPSGGQELYNGYNGFVSGDHLSARAAAGIVFAGALCKQILHARGIRIGSHVLSIGKVRDDSFDKTDINPGTLQCLITERIPLLNPYVRKAIEETVMDAARRRTTLGGVIEAAVTGVPAGLGEPFFDNAESVLSHLLFAIPSVKGVDFGSGFALAEMEGHELGSSAAASEANLAGGFDGGISTGLPVICRAAFRPAQSAPDDADGDLRYDPCSVLRACPVVEAMLAIGVLDLLYSRQARTLSE
ncbi:MAG: chorismate synthase [Abditibacteriota bacterium]|nr:chorismate synthase [Abditibacteriota bacterium]